jgi:prevent-host-death family protein
MGAVITSREFNRDVSAAKRAAEHGPVVITDHGRRSHVLMTADQYDRLAGADQVVGGRLRMTGGEDVDLPLPSRAGDYPRASEL